MKMKVFRFARGRPFSVLAVFAFMCGLPLILLALNVQFGAARNDTQFAALEAWATFALFIVAIAQALLFFQQLVLMRKGLADSEDAARTAKEAADAAKAQALAAAEGAAISRTAMVFGNRAYIHFAGIQHISHRDLGDGHIFWSLRPSWANGGHTPTRDFTSLINYWIDDKPIPETFEFPNAPPESATVTVVAPGARVGGFTMNVSGQDLEEVRDGKKFLYAWGIARYHDVLPDSSWHTTTFCVQAARITGDPTKYWDPTDPVEIMWANYPSYNDAN